MKFFSQNKQKLTESEIGVLSHLNRNYNKIPMLKIEDVSKETMTSKITIVRLCIKLGFSGWSDMKSSIINSDDNKGSSNYIQELEKYISKINLLSKNDQSEEINKVVSAIEKADKIVLMGISSNYRIARTISKKLWAKGYNTYAFRNNHVENTGLSKLGSNDIVIIISYSGETFGIVEATKYINQNASLVSVTSGNHNTLHNKADYKLLVPKIEYNRLEEPLISKIMIEILMDLLANKIKKK